MKAVLTIIYIRRLSCLNCNTQSSYKNSTIVGHSCPTSTRQIYWSNMMVILSTWLLKCAAACLPASNNKIYQTQCAHHYKMQYSYCISQRHLHLKLNFIDYLHLEKCSADTSVLVIVDDLTRLTQDLCPEVARRRQDIWKLNLPSDI